MWFICYYLFYFSHSSRCKFGILLWFQFVFSFKSLACFSPWGCRVRHNWVTELNWTKLSLPIHGLGMAFHLFRSSLMCFVYVLLFLVLSSTSLIKFIFLHIFLVLWIPFVNGTFYLILFLDCLMLIFKNIIGFGAWFLYFVA